MTYSGSPIQLINTPTTALPAGYTMKYAVTTTNSAPADNLYTTTIPSKTDAGTYYVWYKVAGDANHNDTEPAAVQVEIEPVDKTELKKAIEAAQADYDAIKDVERYQAVAEPLGEAIATAAAVAGNDNATESEVGDAITAVSQARATAGEGIAAAFADALAGIDSIGADNKDSVRSTLGLYNNLTDAEKEAVDKKIGRAGTKKLADLGEALEATDRIDALKAADQITANDEKAITLARTAYELLTDSQKAMVSQETLAKLSAAEAQLEEVKNQATAADQLKAAKDSAIERLNDYSEAKAKADATDAEKAAYDKAVADGKKAINAAADKDAVAAALTDAKKAVDAALKSIEDARAEAAAAAAEMAAADKALEDAKKSAEAAKEAADQAAADQYASDADKSAISDAKAAVENAVKAANDLPANATAEQKRGAAKAIEDAVKALNDATDKAKVNSAAAKAKAEEAATAAEQLAVAKAAAIDRLNDYADAKAKADATADEKKAYNDAVDAEKAKINAATDKDA
ncbi:MAG: hypothetical protein IKF99_18345, partial [Oscillospiraceae bacterium]|nr:hypothetical protein [Oscillospiraceae bacterium]